MDNTNKWMGASLAEGTGKDREQSRLEIHPTFPFGDGTR